MAAGQGDSKSKRFGRPAGTRQGARAEGQTTGRGPRQHASSSSGKRGGGAQGGGSQEASGRVPAPSGVEARRLAVWLIGSVIEKGRAFDDALSSAKADGLEPRDRALARLIAATVLRRLGELDNVVTSFLDKGLPAERGSLWPILLAGAAQLLFLNTSPHAAVSLSVDLARADPRARRFDKLVNAVLRRVAERGESIRQTLDVPRINIPPWLWARWCAAYGEETARRIAEASLREAALDLTVRSDPSAWAERLGGVVLPTGSVRLKAKGRIEDLDGYGEGAWWVQDAAAALPARLSGARPGLHVADLCAAPGGKTAELVAAGASVTALDLSERRLETVKENLARLKLSAELVAADATEWSPGRTFDAVLLDAPCTATGTIRRHPDILRLKREGDVAALAAVQAKLLARAVELVRPGGLVVYCTCSLEAEEGERQIAALLARDPRFVRRPIVAGEIGADAAWITPAGDLRTLPFHLDVAGGELSGMDGFYAARLERIA